MPRSRDRHAQLERDPHRLPRLLRAPRPRGRGLEPARAAQRPDAAVHQRRHGAVQERLHRRRAAALSARGHLAEMRARRRQAQRPRQRRLHRAPPHLLRDARELLVRRLLQGCRHRARLEAGHRGVRPARGPPAGPRSMPRTTRRTQLWRKIAGLPERRVLRIPTSDNSGRWARPARAAPAPRSSTTTGPRCRAARRAARTRTATASSRSGTSCSCSSSRSTRQTRAAAQALDRHRHGPRAHRRGAPGPARQLRHRPVPPHHRGERGADRRRGQGAARPSLQGDRRPSARHLVPDRRRRDALQRGPRLRAAPDHAARDAPRPHAGREGAADVAPRAGAGRRDGPGVPRAGRAPRR